jgi:hyperosmotically inducible periplasmic protein
MAVTKLRHVVSMIFVCAMFGVATVSCAPTATTRTVGKTVDDASITAKVKTEIAKEEGLGKALAINVDTYRSVVSLTGFVDSQEQIDKAMSCARRVGGVEEVKNNLSIKPKAKS